LTIRLGAERRKRNFKMLRFLKYLILVPVTIVVLAFAYANKHAVVVSIDPLAGDASQWTVKGPLFLVIIASVIVGVVAGAVSTWFSQGRHRRLARQLRVEREKLKRDLDATRGSDATSMARRA
jgi:uncharacterized integral membrane protein